MLDYIYHMTLILIKITFWAYTRQDFVIFTQLYKERHYITLQNL